VPGQPQSRAGLFERTTARTANRSWWGWWSTAMASYRARDLRRKRTDRRRSMPCSRTGGAASNAWPGDRGRRPGHGVRREPGSDQARHHHYLVATRQGEAAGVRRRLPGPGRLGRGDSGSLRRQTPSRRSPGCGSRGRFEGEELLVLCRSEGRLEKDRAIREKHDERIERGP